MPTADPLRLYELLDSLVALRLEYANGSDGEKAIATLGRAKVLEVRTMLDMAIHNTKRIIEEVPLISRTHPVMRNLRELEVERSVLRAGASSQ